MAQWERDTPWRQGQLLTDEAIVALGLGGPTPSQDIAAVVISHDCDLAQSVEAEPYAELIVGRYIDSVQGSFTHCKNLRRLHLDCTAGPTPRSIELLVGNRTAVSKVSSGALSLSDASSSRSAPSLSDYLPRHDVAMTFRERRVLQRWLAARYERASFPDEFDRRLRDETGVAERISAALKDSGNDIVALFFDVDAGREIVRKTKEELYELSITMVYSTAVNPANAERSANDAAKRIKEMVTRRCRSKDKHGNPGPWFWIELIDIEVISDEALTYAQSQLFVRWHADHISLRTDPLQPMLDD
jgi:hypothetical protein